MQLQQLLTDLPYQLLQGDLSRSVSGLAYDSRQVRPGYLFICLSGNQHQGENFINQALEKGAVAIISASAPTTALPSSVAWIQTEANRWLLAELAKRFYQAPDQQLKLIGITGTNGKTTMSYLLEAIFQAAQQSVGVIGTINYRYPGYNQEAQRTTPESLDTMQMMNHLREAGVANLVMEVSSHALDQGRVHGFDFDVAVLSNITQDHLDYHGDMANYIKAKAKLFAQLEQSHKPHPTAVIHGDDPNCAPILRPTRQRRKVRCWTYGFAQSCELRPTHVEMRHNGFTAQISCSDASLHPSSFTLKSSLVGRHNLMNCLAAVATARALGIEMSVILNGIANMPAVPGRLECISTSHGATLFIDYAHTDDALRNVLQALQAVRLEGQGGRGKIITVFGCGGDRDRTKRPRMGEAAMSLSDYVIITSDNPRREEPLQIINDITATAAVAKLLLPAHDFIQQARRRQAAATIMPDRREAILLAMNLATADDLILIAGKGHETTQEIQGVKHPFSDRRVCEQLMEKLAWKIISV